MNMTHQWEYYLEEVSNLISSRENYQRRLGRIASDLSRDWGSQALESLSEDLKETQGLKVSPTTLRNYRWVHEKTAHLNLPEDLSYRTLQTIASTDDPEKWALRIEKEGLSSSEVYFLILQEKGKEPTVRKCPNCGIVLNAPKTKNKNSQKES